MLIFNTYYSQHLINWLGNITWQDRIKESTSPPRWQMNKNAKNSGLIEENLYIWVTRLIYFTCNINLSGILFPIVLERVTGFQKCSNLRIGLLTKEFRERIQINLQFPNSLYFAPFSSIKLKFVYFNTSFSYHPYFAF